MEKKLRLDEEKSEEERIGRQRREMAQQYSQEKTQDAAVRSSPAAKVMQTREKVDAWKFSPPRPVPRDIVGRGPRSRMISFGKVRSQSNSPR